MIKFLLSGVAIALSFLGIILLLPAIMPDKPIPHYDDQTLREMALSRDIKPIPLDDEGLLRAVDNPNNPMSREKVVLGKKLFFDSLLSKDQTLNCASCHILEQGGDDNLPTAIGYHGRANPSHLNSPTVLNAALAQSQFWDGRAKDVEEQAAGPIQAPFEMNMRPEEVVSRLSAIPEYVDSFQQVFGEPISFRNVQKAIGAYERTLLTYGKFDRFLEGNDTSISPAAKRGLALFIRRGCKGCHTGMSVGGQSIQKFPLRSYPEDLLNLQFSPNLKIVDSTFPFENIGGFLGRDDALRFRVPILRNISKTAPYFHNGSISELEEAVRIMSKYQVGREFTPKEIDDVVEFLKTLDGEMVDYAIGK
ncbi:MAG: cytochrome c peroxidase [Campylobacterota bacterium]|nr:cytochrome c peroxidase [Campylobacterota bacterium]